MEKNQNRYLRWIAFLSGVGTLISVYSFLHKEGFTSGALCNLNETFNCDIVNQGIYSDFFGIPVALIGIIGYAFLFLAIVMKMRTPDDRSLTKFILTASVGGFLFALYLSGLEAFVLRAWCIVCLTSQAIITTTAVLACLNYRKEKLYDRS